MTTKINPNPFHPKPYFKMMTKRNPISLHPKQYFKMTTKINSIRLHLKPYFKMTTKNNPIPFHPKLYFKMTTKRNPIPFHLRPYFKMTTKINPIPFHPSSRQLQRQADNLQLSPLIFVARGASRRSFARFRFCSLTSRCCRPLAPRPPVLLVQLWRQRMDTRPCQRIR